MISEGNISAVDRLPQSQPRHPSYTVVLSASLQVAMTTRRRAREIVLQVLFEEEFHPTRDDDPSHEFLNQRLLSNRPLVQFATELLQGVRSHRKEIDLLLSKNAANWSLKRMSAIDRNILRIAAYEMFFGSVPGRVAINEAVDIAKRYGSRNSGQFVNGLLDRLLKEREAPAEQ